MLAVVVVVPHFLVLVDQHIHNLVVVMVVGVVMVNPVILPLQIVAGVVVVQVALEEDH
jgi:hypothetical protein